MEKERDSGKERDLDASQLPSLKSILSLLDEDELVYDRIPKPKSNKREGSSSGSRSENSEQKFHICRSPGCKCQFPELKDAVLQPRESLRNRRGPGTNLPSANQGTAAAADAFPLPSARTPLDLHASSLQAPQTSLSDISDGPTPNTTLSPSRWTPQDDGIEIPVSSQEMDAHSRSVLYGPCSGRRLSAFVELGRTSDCIRDDPDEEATNTG
ncbi:hypothetical protein Salat_1627900 [Sesamum alatum]|uniref:Uncharacterized protein n=1 Tax=Sesamum alatum TaxID=300844 RepID=A0AAE1Y5X6_9LAMI|nr:hypothetical protein Salat_1627900 [Sesamum alatum]